MPAIGLLAGLVLLHLVWAEAPAADGENWRVASPGFAWSFPADHWAHRDYRIEWWYLTGHLESATTPPRRFGYQFTLFRIGLLRGERRFESAWSTTQLVMAHAALTDVDGRTHRFSDVLHRETPLLAGFGGAGDERIGWIRAPAGTDADWSLRWNGEGFDLAMADAAAGFAFDLQTRAIKPRVFQAPEGLSRKSGDPDAASHYYSFTRLATAGQVQQAGERHAVRGESWMDHEFSSSQLGEGQVGWDWFSLQLDDGRELMLYLMRRADGSVDRRSGTWVDADGRPRWLSEGEFAVEATSRWRSPTSGIEYPSGWALRVPLADLDLTLTPLLKDQENIARAVQGLSYWEGAVDVRDVAGRSAGRGYVELAGYGEGAGLPSILSRPAPSR